MTKETVNQLFVRRDSECTWFSKPPRFVLAICSFKHKPELSSAHWYTKTCLPTGLLQIKLSVKQKDLELRTLRIP